MNVFDLSAKLTLDTNEYERNISSAAKGADTLKSSFSTAGTGSTTLQNQIAVLAGQYEEAQQKVARLADEFNKSVEATGTTSTETRELAEKLAEAQLEADNLGKSLEAAGGSAENAGGRFEGLKEKIGKGLKVAAEVGVAAITAAATAVGALAKQSVQSYSEYEQLVGGVEKIFDEVDISGIIEDATNAYKDLNMSANEYLTAINQTGAAFAQTMGDERGYEVARTGMMAIADYASGTGRNLDELNEKYALITRSTSSYQSIADQFSGILPATSAGFLEQAKAAGFLEESYTSLTEVPIEEYQEAVTKMLEKGVQDMGLAGNTAKEAATTISGSLAMTKAAWKNLLTGLSDPNANIDQLIDNMVSSAEAAITNLLPAVERAVTGIGKVVEKLAPIIAERLPAIIQDVLPALVNAAGALINGLVAALPTIIQVLVDVLPDIINQLMTALTDNLPAIIQGVIQLVAGLVAALPEIIAGLIAAIPDIISAIIEAFGPIVEQLGQVFSQAWEAIKNIFAPVGEWFTERKEDVQNAFAAVDSWFSEKFTAARDAVHTAWSAIGSWFGERWADIQSAMQSVNSWFSEKFTSAKDAVHTAWNGIGSFFSEKWTQIKDVFANAKDIFKGIGANIVKGLIAGIGEWIGNAIEKARELIRSVKSAASREAEIASPSKAFRRMGRFIDEGLMLGIDDEENKPVSAMTQIMKKLMGAGQGLRFSSSMSYNASRSSGYPSGEEPMQPIILQVVLDGKVIGETSYNYIRRRTRMVGA